jgi:hypothetical protein
LQVIGFTAYSLPKNNSETIGKQFFKKNKSLVNSQYTNSRQVSGAGFFLDWKKTSHYKLYLHDVSSA